MAENIPLEQRAGRNIGIESLPVFIQAAAAPEVTVVPSGAAPGGTPATLMTAVKNAVRTPFTRGPENGMIFNRSADEPSYTVWLDDGEGNMFLIADDSISGNDVDALNLTGEGNPFTNAQPLLLCGNEKIVMRAYVGAS